MIESESNPRIKRLKRLLSDRRFRQRENRLVIEGSRWLKEMVTPELTSSTIDGWFATEGWLNQQPGLAEQLNTHYGPATLLTEPLMAKVSDTASPPGAIAIVEPPSHKIPSNPQLILILDELRDPGNLGTLIRSAAAVGADAVLLGPNTVDRFNPKVVRSTMGALFRIPILRSDWTTIPTQLGECQLHLADMHGQQSYTTVDWFRPTALVIGGEAHGPSPHARSMIQQTVSIPMGNGVESLNAAVAGSVILFEIVRQRRASAL